MVWVRSGNYTSKLDSVLLITDIYYLLSHLCLILFFINMCEVLKTMHHLMLTQLQICCACIMTIKFLNLESACIKQGLKTLLHKLLMSDLEGFVRQFCNFLLLTLNLCYLNLSIASCCISVCPLQYKLLVNQLF